MGKSLQEGRRPRGYLTGDLNNICKMFVTGEIQLREGVYLTPSVASRLFGEIEGTPKEDLPSHGAIDRIFKRWEEIGYAELRRTPLAFVDFTEAGRELGLEELERKHAVYKRAESLIAKAERLEAEAAEAARLAEEAAANHAAETD